MCATANLPLRSDVFTRSRSCRILREFWELEEIAEEWNALWSSDPDRQVFQSLPWVRAWVGAYYHRYRLYSPAVYENGRLIGLLPLVAQGRQLGFIGAPGSDYNGPVCEPGRRAMVMEAALAELLRHSRDWDRLLLENVPEWMSFDDILAQLPPAIQKQVERGPATPCPTLILDGDKQSILAGLLRKDHAKKAYRLTGKLGAVGFRHIEQRREILQHLPAFFRQHIRRQHVAGRGSAYSNAEPAAFCRGLVDRLDPTRDLRFSVLELDGKPAAYHLGFQVNGKYLYYKPTFDIDLWDYSPGQVLLYELLRASEAADIREFDFCQGGEPYKYRFSNLTRQNRTYTVYPQGPSGELRRTVEHAVAGAKARLESRPGLKERLLNLADALRGAAAKTAVHGWRGLLGVCLQAGIVKWSRVTLSERLPAPVESAPASAGCVVAPGTLGRLADFACSAGVVDTAELRIARDRLKKGHQAYLVTDHDVLVQVVWVAGAAQLQDHELVRRCRLPETALVVYDCWAGCGRKPVIAANVLGEIFAAAEKKDLATWLLSPGDRRSSAVSLDLGAQPRYRWLSLELLQRFTFSRLTPLTTA